MATISTAASIPISLYKCELAEETLFAILMNWRAKKQVKSTTHPNSNQWVDGSDYFIPVIWRLEIYVSVFESSVVVDLSRGAIRSLVGTLDACVLTMGYTIHKPIIINYLEEFDDYD